MNGVESLAPGASIGPYRAVRSLGQGGMASVWLADEVGTGRAVVLKFPDLAQIGDPAVYERFRREVEIGRSVDHPAVPKALELREDWGRPYVVMEYVSGRLLRDILQSEGPLPVERAIDVCAQLLDALAHLHAHGICHRDLKPENLLVTPEGQLRIIDFGLAMWDGQPRVTWRGFSGLAGTPGYMAPEQIRGERGGPPADLYAAGVLFFEMLAGRTPFVADHPLAAMHQALYDEPPPIGRFRDVPPGLGRVLERALRRDPAARYTSAEQFRDDLLHLDRVAARPPEAEAGRGGRVAGRWSLWIVEHPLQLMGIAFVATLVATLLAVLAFRRG